MALVLAGAVDGDRPARVLLDGALIALAANLANLLDRAPGRTVKWSLLCYLPLAVVAGTAAPGVALAVVAGAAAALLVGDLREQFMLGDTGANALGAALGCGAVLVFGAGVRDILAACSARSHAPLGGGVLQPHHRRCRPPPPLRPAGSAHSRGAGMRATARAMAVLVAVVVAGLAVVGPAGGSPSQAGDTTGGRLLVVSLPGVTWTEVAEHDLPALESVLEGAALADLAPRGVLARSGPGDAYLTISAGTRATTQRVVDGQVLALEEQSSGSAAGEIFTRRTGLTPSGPYVSLSWPALVRSNAARPYDAELGLLAETLTEAGIRTSVIGNADGTDSIGASYERQVGLALASPDGVVDDGALAKNLIVSDASRPFGQRFDPPVVLDQFRAAWTRAAEGAGGVVLLEASDLARVMRYRPLVSARRYDVLRRQALRDTDDLLADVLDNVNPDRDSVLVVAPYNLPGDRDLTAVALRTPTSKPGYLMSASTQRSGFLTLVDLGPTILDRFGIVRPTAMEGRPAEIVASGAGLSSRVDHLISLNEASRFRERLLTPTTLVVVLLLVVVAAGAAIVVAGGRSRRWRRALAYGALVDLAVLPASYLARGLPLEEMGVGVYWAVVVGVSAVAAGGATVVARRTGRPSLALVLVLALVALVLVGDVTTGSRLSLNAAFGYSPTGNSRLYGISNYSYGQVASAVCLLAAFAAAREPVRRGRLVALGLLGGTLVVLGAPTWGADVGGVLAFTPTILVFGALVLHRRIRLTTLVAGAVATALAIIAFGLLDLARPANQRAHLGRLFERVGDEGIGPLLSIVQRKLLANLEVSTSSLWVAAVPIALALWALITRHPSRPLDALRADLPTLGAGLAAAVVAAILGSLLNDSGAIVGGVAAMVIAASLVHLLMVHGERSAPG